MPKKIEEQKDNPLKKYFRQPKIYLKLPSRGEFYNSNELDMPENSEVPVYPMTAKDELLFKTPDALINGQATVDVIKSCIPNIRNPWSMPSIDMDAVLIAIRLATYGEKMTISVKIPEIGDDKDFEIDLRTLLDSLINANYNSTVFYNDMEIKIRPLNYDEFTKNAMSTFEEQKIYTLVNDKTIPDDKKMKLFSESFMKLTDLTISIVSQSIVSIKVDGKIVSDQKQIKEFMDNVDKQFYQAILDHITNQRDAFSVKPFKGTTTEAEPKRGAPKEFDVPITFDQSNFFA